MDDGEGPAVGPLKTSDTMGNDREPIATVASMLGLAGHRFFTSHKPINNGITTSTSESFYENLCMMEMVDGNFSSHEVDELMGRIGQQARPSFSEQQQNELFQAESDFMQNQSSPLFDMGTDLSNPSLTSSNMDEFSALMAQATYPSAYGHSVNTSTHHSPITSHSNAVSPNTSHSNPVSPQMLHMASPPSLHSTMYEPSATYAITRQSSSSSVQTSPIFKLFTQQHESYLRGLRASPARKALIRAASVGGPIRNLTSTSMSTAPILLRNKPSSFSAPTSPTAGNVFRTYWGYSSPRPSAQSSSSSTPVASPAASPMQRPLTSGSIVTSPSSSISSSPKPSAVNSVSK
ncbi:hypothetical protein BC829DRAFT_448298 [Chytridium lagenaria]|nr:hypothetical protein BC829DRAFT_448298 [Chytridium lagenaria]